MAYCRAVGLPPTQELATYGVSNMNPGTKNYNDGKWHGWNGGECPVHPETLVRVIFEDGSGPSGPQTAGVWDWSGLHPVVFRVVKEYKEPKEFYSACGIYFSTKELAEGYVDLYSPDATIKTYREVLD